MATKIICHAQNCIFWENKHCTAEEIIYDPKEGCLTYEVVDETLDDVWDDEDLAWEDDIEADDALFDGF